MKTSAIACQIGDHLTLRLPKWIGRGTWNGNDVVQAVVEKMTDKTVVLTLPDGTTTRRRISTIFKNQVLRDGVARSGENHPLF